MLFNNLLNHIVSRPSKPRSGKPKPQPGKRRTRAGRSHRRRAILESLEDRQLLAALTVVTPGDAGSGACTAGACTLRDAVATANATAGADTITFDAAVVGTITLNPSGGALSITDPVSITGPGANVLEVHANASVANEFRVFDIEATAGDVSLAGLKLTGGRVVDSLEGGGAIQFLSDGVLSIQSSVISGNTADRGGGIYSEFGTVDITSSTISNNVALFSAGGGIHNEDGDTTLTSSYLSNNRSYGSGGGLFSRNAGAVTVTDTEISGNSITGDAYFGGGLYSGEGAVTISGSTISGNSSLSDAGGIYNYSGAFTINNSTITNNTAGDSGAGIFNDAGDLSITNSTISDNTSLYGDGGGISNGTGSLTLTRSTLSGNASVNDGGGISNNSGQINAVDSTLSDNSSGVDGGAIATISGGVTLTNSTLSGNATNIRGGGIRSDSAAVRLVNSTVTRNSALIDGGGIAVAANNDGESILIHNSIVADNTSPNGPDFIAPGNPGANLVVASSLIGHNGATTLPPSPSPDANGNLIGSAAVPIAPFLGDLAENGGPTQTHDVFFGSPALDSGNNALAINFGPDGAPGGNDDTPLVSDQRNGLFERFVDFGSGSTTTDMGAVEAQGTPLLMVDTTDDIVNGNLAAGDRSLRELIALANESGGPETILFAGGLPSTITLDPALGPLEISDPLTLSGPVVDTLTIAKDPAQQFRLLNITSTAGDVSLIGLSFTGGNAGAEDGGAILSQSTGNLIITHSTLANNSAASGGAVAATSGTVAIAASTLSQNTATADGGAVAVTTASTALTLVDSTLSGNTATGAGGGIFSENAAVTAISSTLTLNVAGTAGGGIGLLANGGGESLNLDNTIVAGNTAATGPEFNAPMNPVPGLNVDSSLIGDNADTSLTESSLSGGQPQADARGNLIGGGAYPAIDPGLVPLALNGGTTMTHSLLDTSLAFNAGNLSLIPTDTYDVDRDNNPAEFLPVDQRGAPRTVDNIDIGALELLPAPNVTWNNPANIIYNTPLSATQLNAAASEAGTFQYTPPADTTLAAGDGQVLTALFTPTDPFAFRSVTSTVTINVLKADPVITWATPANIVFGTLLSDTQLNATADVTGTFVYDPDVDAALDVGDHTLSVTFTPDDSANYNPGGAMVTLTVDKANPVITWNDPAGITFGTALDGTQLNATADVGGTFVYDPVADTQLNAGDNQSLSVTFTPGDNNYNEITASVMIDVAKADPVITWANPADIDFGTLLDSTQLNATADIVGTFVYDPAAGTQLGAGPNQQLGATFTPTDAVNYNSASATVLINVTGQPDDPIVTISPTGPAGAPDPADLPSGSQPTLWATQRSDLREIVIELGSPISAPSPSDLVLTNLGLDADTDADVIVPLSASHLSLSGDSLQLSISFGPGELDNGVYQLELSPAITGGATFTYTGDANNKFHVLTGDWNGSGGVNIQDFATFAYWFGKNVPTAPHYVDVNDTGGINIQDFAGFAGNFSKSVAFPNSMAGLSAGGEGELESALATLVNPPDVNGDGAVTARDALGVINELASGNSDDLAWSPFDVSRDGSVTALDALQVINRLEELHGSGGEAELQIDTLLSSEAEESDRPDEAGGLESIATAAKLSSTDGASPAATGSPEATAGESGSDDSGSKDLKWCDLVDQAIASEL